MTVRPLQRILGLLMADKNLALDELPPSRQHVELLSASLLEVTSHPSTC
jgi:hypothetical protein